MNNFGQHFLVHNLSKHFLSIVTKCYAYLLNNLIQFGVVNMGQHIWLPPSATCMMSCTVEPLQWIQLTSRFMQIIWISEYVFPHFSLSKFMEILNTGGSHHNLQRVCISLTASQSSSCSWLQCDLFLQHQPAHPCSTNNVRSSYMINIWSIDSRTCHPSIHRLFIIPLVLLDWRLWRQTKYLNKFLLVCVRKRYRDKRTDGRTDWHINCWTDGQTDGENSYK